MSRKVSVEDTIPAESSGEDPQGDLEQPIRIGRYQIQSRLGAGAMGVVYAAYDAELERELAIKLVAGSHGPEADELSERLLREARALARLEHPNVVRVYEVGNYRGQIYIAMEQVRGRTLGEWLALKTRPWRVTLEVLLAAGKALQAAHSAGLVHCDFKPDNVLIDEADRPRVVDFGLVKDSERTTVREPGVSSGFLDKTSAGSGAATESTQLGEFLGTPAYMSPEQHFGQPAGPYSDQYSFCIVLYEALYGTRPFDGDSWGAIRSRVESGIVPPPPDSRVPRRLFRSITRGLSRRPEDRWPSMDALLEALAYDPWRARMRAAAIAGLIGAIATATYAAVLGFNQTSGERCDATSQLVGAWDAERATAVSRAFAATQAPYAADTWARVEPRLDAYAEAWSSEWKASCEAHASGAQTSRMTDLRMACLSRRKTHLSALVDVFVAADAAVVENAIQAVAALPSTGGCGDVETLLTPAPLPDDPQAASRVEGSRTQLALAEALEKTGQFERGLQVAAQVRTGAGGLEYAPLSAEAALVEGRLLMNLGRAVEADAALIRAIQLGIAGDLHAIAAEAATIRIFVVGQLLGKPDDALAVIPVVEPLVRRARDDGQLSALLLNNIGVVYAAVDDEEQSRSYFQRAIDAMKQRAGPQDPLIAVTYNNLANLSYTRGDHEAARRGYQQSVELFTALLGDSHPLLAHPLGGLGDVSVREGRPLDAVASYTRALALMESSYGVEHPFLLNILPGLGRAQAMTGRAEEARRHLARAVEIAERHGQRSVELASALEGLGDLAAELEQERARGLYERALAVFEETAGVDSERGARAALRAGELASESGDRAGAIALYERALAKKTGPREHAKIRVDAALRLAAVLADGEADARACALVTEGRAGIPEGDPRRAEVDALAARACPKG